MRSNLFRRSIFVNTMVLLPCLFFSLGAFAQKKPKNGETSVNGDFEVVRPYKPILAEANKQRVDPDTVFEDSYSLKIKYNSNHKKVDLKPNMETLPTVNFKSANGVSLPKNSRIELGGGSFNSAIGEVDINSGRLKERWTLGLVGNGIFRAKQSNRTDFGKLNLEASSNYSSPSVAVTSRIGIKARDASYWDYMPDFSVSNLKNRLHSTLYNADVNISNSYSRNENHVSFEANVLAYGLNATYDAKESGAKIDLNAKAPNKLKYGLNVEASYEYSEASFLSLDSLHNTQYFSQFSGKPTFSGLLGKMSWRLGAAFVLYSSNSLSEKKDFSDFNVFPSLELQLPIFSKDAKLYAIIGGGSVVNNLRSNFFVTPYLVRNNEFQRTINKIDATIGGLGTLFPKVSVGLSLNMKLMDNFQNYLLGSTYSSQPLFANNVYWIEVVKEEVKVFTPAFELQIDDGKLMNFSSRISYSIYAMPSGYTAYTYPSLRAFAALTLKLTPQLLFKVNVDHMGDLKVAHASTTNDGTRKYAETTIGAFTNLSSKLEYTMKQKFSLFVKVDNLLNDTYRQYLFYPQLTRSFFGGVGWSF